MVSKYRNPKRGVLEDITRALRTLPKSSLKRVVLATCLAILSNILDLIAVGIVGATAVLVVGASPSEGSRVLWLLEILNLDNSTLQTQILILSFIGFAFFTFKTIFLALTNRRVLFFLSKESARMTITLLSRLMNQSLLLLNKNSLQERIYALTIGVNTLTVGILGSLFSIAADASLLLIMFVGLFYFDPAIALSTIITFSAVAGVLHKVTAGRIAKFSEQYTNKTISSQQDIQTALNLYREIRTRNSTNYFLERISKERVDLAFLQAEMRFLPSLGKYVFELSIVSISLCVAWYQFKNSDATRAVSAMALFLAASTRIAPSIMRLQQGVISIKSSIGMCDPTFNLLSDINHSEADKPAISSVRTGRNTKASFLPQIKVKGLSFSYPGAKSLTLNNVYFELKPYQFCVIKGRSGAGKSTLIDIMLGLLPIYGGEVTISGLPPRDAIDAFPGKVSYVPQETILVKGTILDNIYLGLDFQSKTSKNIDFALKYSGLKSVVSQLPQGLNTELGDRGSGLSGGQKQRVGLARALVTRPELLILDEATSALDIETEKEVISNLIELKKRMSILAISHRRETLQKADLVVDISKGRLEVIDTHH